MLVQSSLVLHTIGCFVRVTSGHCLSERIRRGLKSVWIPEELIYHVGHMRLAGEAFGVVYRGMSESQADRSPSAF